MVSQTCLVFMILTVLKSIDQVFWRLSLNSDLPVVFLIIRLELWFGGKKTTEVNCPSDHIIPRILTISMAYLFDVNLDHLASGSACRVSLL